MAINKLKISKGLIIRAPYINFILEGIKTWEMRSTNTKHRGWFGLIGKGTGEICGVARLIDIGLPLSINEMLENKEKHRIPESKILSGEVEKWKVPWIIRDVIPLRRPIPYEHKKGAVTWVLLNEGVSKEIKHQIAAIEFEQN